MKVMGRERGEGVKARARGREGGQGEGGNRDGAKYLLPRPARVSCGRRTAQAWGKCALKLVEEDGQVRAGC